MNIQQHGELLLEEWALCKNARPKSDAINLQIERDALEYWANYLSRNLSWHPAHVHTAESIYQFESRLKSYREKVIVEILTHGSV
jgi:hypothetical protein